MKDAAGDIRAKIMSHSRGLGTATPEMLEKRARELAVINGRNSDEFNEADILEAKQELVRTRQVAEDVDEPEATVTTGREKVQGSSGHKTETRPARDEQLVAEELVQEGLDEAEHDRMYEASKEQGEEKPNEP
jgi:hypothetical protein